VNLPSFTAEASVYPTVSSYAGRARRAAQSDVVQPQYVLRDWTPCVWLSFCCLKLEDRSCCRDWRLQCIAP
jgi:hypothetical protein